MIGRIEALLAQRERVFVCIDGMSCAGKSTLATRIALIFGGNVVHMDDFFLPRAERQERPGGNIDARRLLAEVLEPLRAGGPASYRAFDCAAQRLNDAVIMTPKALTVVEGSYSMLPELRGSYDLKVFMRILHDEQRRRVLVREAERAGAFFGEWIPREDSYFKALDIAARCDIIIDV